MMATPAGLSEEFFDRAAEAIGSFDDSDSDCYFMAVPSDDMWYLRLLMEAYAKPHRKRRVFKRRMSRVLGEWNRARIRGLGRHDWATTQSQLLSIVTLRGAVPDSSPT